MRKKPTSRFFNSKNMVGLFIIFLMVSSILAIWQGSSDPQQQATTYNGYTFEQRRDVIVTEISDQEVTFRYSPLEVEGIPFPTEVVSLIKNATRYHITFDPDAQNGEYYDLLRLDIAQNNFAERFNLYFSDSVTQETQIYALPVITCANATATIPVLYFRLTNTTNIAFQHTCVVIDAENPQQLFKARDKLLYLLLGIIRY